MGNKKFAEKLKQARINAGLTQKSVYEKLGLAQSTFSSWETGKSEPDANTLMTLCAMYRITNLEYLFDSIINADENNKKTYAQLQNLTHSKLKKFTHDQLKKLTYEQLENLSPENQEKALEYINLLNMLEDKQAIEKENLVDFEKEA